jgi:hypothetical protein
MNPTSNGRPEGGLKIGGSGSPARGQHPVSTLFEPCSNRHPRIDESLTIEELLGTGGV